jgi:polyisoprenoid-binding protein YceI
VTRDVGGSLVFDPDGNLLSDQSRIIVDLRNLKSDESRRDNFIQRNTLQTSTYPTAEFVPTAAPGLTWPLPTSGSAQFQLTGPLTVHGVTQDALWQVNATFSETEIAGTSSTRVKLTDFGMAPPKAGPVLSVEDELTLEIDFRTAPGPV